MSTDETYAVGDAVWHPAHGNGIVRSLDGGHPLIEFASGETIAILSTSAKLRLAAEVAEPEREEAALRTRLRDWRRQQALVDRRPPYDIATDAMLDAIAVAHPRSMAALSAIPGVGPSRLKRYGTEILRCVAGTMVG